MFRKKRVVFLTILLGLVILIIIKGIPFIDRNFKSSKRVIVVDPGHGGKDPGTIGFSGNYEKEVNLEISKKLKKKLKSNGYKVILTRDSDEYVDNLLRAKTANKKRARVFISIHCNSMENNSSVDGVQVLYYPNRESTIGDLNNNELAQIMMNSMVNGTGAKDKGIIERKNLIVLNQTKMPAIIIECGFLSNKNEEKLLLTEDYQNKIVDSIIDGLEEYLSLNTGSEMRK
ncbi:MULTISPECIES: N-acetylmuramoyl-L-alanine amidase family protein [Tissierellales]|uniref:N-acetylmuramoyl-L-alanine amidase family protein n=1 Tax=Tissierellales TaxID=1737405 RepID=UPI0013564D12|nr:MULTISPECIES: N-acetylmuramoyl-L-alanine amidase [Tissierellales]